MGSPRWRRLAPPGSPWPARGCPTKGQPVWGLCSASPWRWWPCTFRALHQRDVSAPRCTCGAPLDERGRVAAPRRASPGACELPTASISWLSSPSAAATARRASGRAPTNRNSRPAGLVETGLGRVISNDGQKGGSGTSRPARSRSRRLSSPSAAATARRASGRASTNPSSRTAGSVETGVGAVISNKRQEGVSGTARPARSRAPSTSRRWKGCCRTKQDSRSQCANQISLLQSTTWHPTLWLICAQGPGRRRGEGEGGGRRRGQAQTEIGD